GAGGVPPAGPGPRGVPGKGGGPPAPPAGRRRPRPPPRRQRLLRRRLPPRLRQPRPRDVRLLPGDGAGPARRPRRPPGAPAGCRTGAAAMTPAPAPPGIDPEHFRRLGHAVVDLVTDYLAGVARGPVFRPMEPDARAELAEAVWG